MKRSNLTLLTIGSLVLPCFLAGFVQSDENQFRNVIAPIFSKHCFSCHNQQTRKGDFSLESADEFFAGQFVVAGDAKSSHLVELITSVDGTRAEMPKSGNSLTRAQIDSIKKWVDDGAKWPKGLEIESNQQINFDWWSFKPLVRPSVPKFEDSKDQQSIRTPIDAFILRKLQQNGLELSRPADKRSLIRRLSFDLTGLPPTFEEIQDFLNDESPLAYQNLVDKFLASPRYGERWARHWLDVVKYADTCGYDKDKLRHNAWPYRDYVIRSLNDDKPYAQFVLEQIAGDAIYPDSPEGILGLGFLAAGPWDFIGHVEVSESKIDGQVARNLDRDDMLSNTLNTFCSITIQCARCHNHKFDPISQKDYYSLQAVFAAVDRADRVYEQDPKVETQRVDLLAAISSLEKSIAEIEKQIESAGGKPLQALTDQIAATSAKQTSNKKPEFGYHSQIASSADIEKWVELEYDAPLPITELILHPAHDEFNNIGSGFGFPVRFKITVDDKIVFDQTRSDFPNPGTKPLRIPVNGAAERIRMIATRLAPRKDDFIFALAEIEVIHNEKNVANSASVQALDSIEAPVRWSKSNLIDGVWFESKADELKKLKETKQERVVDLVGKESVKKLAAWRSRLAKAKSHLSKIPQGKMVYAATSQFKPQGNFKPTNGKPRQIHFLERGDVTSPGEVVGPGLLTLNPKNVPERNSDLNLDDSATDQQRREALARWIASDKNPLTWRTIVNRVWHYHFGNGLVDTPNDFGRMGGAASHPELLDWLAVEFRDNGGSLKQLHRMIVSSTVYRQSSKSNQAAAEIDSGNRFLWKMNRRRLSAEEIRDSVLMTSGQLNLKMGGAGYYLFALEKTTHSPHYEYHKFDHTDSNSYRRSIYRFIARSQPDPYMTTLDCADSSQSTPARSETQTPLQSLTMLNSDFSLVMAKHFADRLRAQSDSLKTQTEDAVQIALGRRISLQEQTLFQEYATKHGLENLLRLIFNMSEFVFID